MQVNFIKSTLQIKSIRIGDKAWRLGIEIDSNVLNVLHCARLLMTARAQYCDSMIVFDVASSFGVRHRH